VWRLAGVLGAAGTQVSVFDPNCCDGPPEAALDDVLGQVAWDVVGVSTTGMTLCYDLALAYRARRRRPAALMVAGGMEATFDAEAMLRLGPFDLVVLGEGERPLGEICARLRAGAALEGVPGTAWRTEDGGVGRLPQPALRREELRDAVFRTPYERMPYRAYWARLENAYRVGELPVKAEREARLAEIRSVRLITLNYCPMGCTFCSSTNFLNAAQDSTALLGRLDTAECLHMLGRIVSAFPDARTVIFQDDIFAFPRDGRILPLCQGIVEAKARGELPRDLQFISTNRIDAMDDERLGWVRRAGFRVLGFGVESFSLAALREFGKARIHPRISGVLGSALRLGITPFMDMILTSPRGTLADLAQNVREAFKWVQAGCEVGMYPYVIPFSGAAMSGDLSLRPHTVYARRQVAGTGVAWDQPCKILPADPDLREAILAIEAVFEERLAWLERHVSHLPSRVRSLLWVACAVPVLRAADCATPDPEAAVQVLMSHLPRMGSGKREELRRISPSWDSTAAPAR
jgi:radical SAM superfamily enzyme YgiQ (UPF0313 family)